MPPKLLDAPPGNSWTLLKWVRRTTVISLAFATADPTGVRAQHLHGGPPQASPAQDQRLSPRSSSTAGDPEVDTVITIAITPEGFVPSSVSVKRGRRVRLVLLRKAESACPREFLLDEYFIWRRLPVNTPVTEHFTVGRTGTFPIQCRDSPLEGTLTVVD